MIAGANAHTKKTRMNNSNKRSQPSVQPTHRANQEPNQPFLQSASRNHQAHNTRGPGKTSDGRKNKWNPFWLGTASSLRCKKGHRKKKRTPCSCWLSVKGNPSPPQKKKNPKYIYIYIYIYILAPRSWAAGSSDTGLGCCYTSPLNRAGLTASETDALKWISSFWLAPFLAGFKRRPKGQPPFCFRFFLVFMDPTANIGVDSRN